MSPQEEELVRALRGIVCQTRVRISDMQAANDPDGQQEAVPAISPEIYNNARDLAYHVERLLKNLGMSG